MFDTWLRPKPGIERYRTRLGVRYRTMRYAFDQFAAIGGRTIVELGTSRSFVNDARKGCLVNDVKYWKSQRPSHWDWGSGLFTRMCALHFQDLRPAIHSVDISPDAIAISKVITADFSGLVTHHLMPSEQFLAHFEGKIDLLYMDAGELEDKADELNLREAKIVLERQLLSPRAVVLIDDVIYPGKSASKGTYSIPLFCQHGFKISIADYQFVLQKSD